MGVRTEWDSNPRPSELQVKSTNHYTTVLPGNDTFTHLTVALLGFAELLGEEDELGSVLLEALDIGLKGLHRPVLPPVVNRDADGGGKLLVDSSSLGTLNNISCNIYINYTMEPQFTELQM